MRESARRPRACWSPRWDARRMFSTLSSLAGSVDSAVSRFDEAEAARICGQAARVLAAAFTRETDASARSLLADGLAKVMRRLEPSEAGRICARRLAGSSTRWTAR